MSKTTTPGKTLKPMTPAAVEAAARADRDARPLTAEDLRRMKRTPQAKIIRRALALTQEEFAIRYHIPLGTLRDWEQGRAEPDQPTKAYLMLIARSRSRESYAELEATLELTKWASFREKPMTEWSWRRDLNPRPSDYKSDALPTELRQHVFYFV